MITLPAPVRRAHASLAPGEPRRLGLMFGVIGLLHVAGFGALLLHDAVAAGVGVTAYTLGVRHAFDADHIAAIDNTTRKLMADGQRPLGAGFFFSLGHSTVVFGLAALFTLGVGALAGPVRDDGSALHTVTGVVGASISGTFLYVIAAINIIVLVGLVRARRRAPAAADGPVPGGLLSLLLGRLTGSITRTWQLYPLGVLFGLGFDTATEVALLFLAAGAAGAGLPWYAILCLPALFAAGMALFDTIDGCLMRGVYGWSQERPRAGIPYNILVTALSAFTALVIGTIELLGVLAERAGLSGGFWEWVVAVDLNTLGFLIVGLFLALWAVAAMACRFPPWKRRSTCRIC